ncbi:MAG: hypothetical protein CME62_11970 [Halobacteriovoraceae bacterium]|nr:hypothetical protein [Halobacteriovoraceae bacterium]|tara:strand:+ start:26764 stop:28368 length:1605 start_codon:yes stop_codon:yes gene_type:complete
MKKYSIFLLMVLLGCRATQDAVEYGVSISPLSQPDKSYSTRMNTPLKINYVVEKDESSINPKLVLSKNPSFGKLDDCEMQELSFECTYIPYHNFAGVDTIEVRAIDGEITAKKDAVISIHVIDPSNHPPKVGANQTFLGEQNQVITIVTNEGEDSDSSKYELNYIVYSPPQNGELINCFQGTGVNYCQYKPHHNFIGTDEFSYRVKDKDGNFSLQAAKVSLEVTPKLMNGEEIFHEAQNKIVNSVDITWIIDNSGSMQNDQERLKLNFESFIQNFLKDENGNKTSQYPFKMGVTTTEAYRSGKTKMSEESPGQMFELTSAAAEANYQKFVEDFKSAVGVGVAGSGNEKALLSGREIYKNYSSWYGGNDSLSVYIIVSDEMEQSLAKDKDNKGVAYLDSDNQAYTIERWVQEYQQTKDNPSKVRIFPIIMKSSDHGMVKGDMGGHYRKVAELSGGKVYDLVESFDEVLDGMAQSITYLFGSYLLKGDRVIDANTIQVKINNQVVTNWTYENYALKFNSSPPAGSTIKVSYKYYLK